MSANLLPPSVLQNADREYKALLSQESVLNDAKSYSRQEKRLDIWWLEIFDQNSATENLKEVVKMFSTLSNGNATLERGFSVIEHILVENLKKDSLIAQLVVYDVTMDAGKLEEYDIPKSLVLPMINAHSRYKESESNRKNKVSEQEKAKA